MLHFLLLSASLLWPLRVGRCLMLVVVEHLQYFLQIHCLTSSNKNAIMIMLLKSLKITRSIQSSPSQRKWYNIFCSELSCSMERGACQGQLSILQDVHVLGHMLVSADSIQRCVKIVTSPLLTLFVQSHCNLNLNSTSHRKEPPFYEKTVFNHVFSAGTVFSLGHRTQLCSSHLEGMESN